MALAAMGRPQWMAVDSAAKVAGMTILVPLGYVRGGFAGAVAGFAAAEALSYASSVLGLWRVGISALPLDIGLSIVTVLTSLLGLTVQVELGHVLVGFGFTHRVRTFGEGVGVFLTVTLTWGALFWVARRVRARDGPPPAVPG
jgi:hypothetical protein